MTDDLFVIAEGERCFQKSMGTLLNMVISEQRNLDLKFYLVTTNNAKKQNKFKPAQQKALRSFSVMPYALNGCLTPV